LQDRVVRFAVLSLLIVSSGALGQEPPRFAYPYGYTQQSENGQYTFVMLAPAGSDLSKLPDYRKQTEDLAKRYPASGMYKTGETTPVWTYSGPYAYEANPANDGVHLAVLEGESWFTSQFVSSQRLPSEVEQAQLDAPAVSFYANGQLLKSHSLRSICDPAKLRHSPQHVQWRAGEGLVEKAGRYVVFTQDGRKVTFNLQTGDLISNEPAGQGAKYYLAAILGLTVIFVLVAVIFLVRKPKSAGTPAGALAGSGPAP
jgi:hypothetical protein